MSDETQSPDSVLAQRVGSGTHGQEPSANSTSDAVGGGGVGGSLEAQIRSLPIASLRRNYAQALMDWADTDTAVRITARRVLTEFETEGDSYGVPMIEDIVDLLVARLEAVAGGRVDVCEQSGAGSTTAGDELLTPRPVRPDKEGA